MEISCLTGAGIPELQRELSKRVRALRIREKESPSPAV
jgi:hypothetical protein